MTNQITDKKAISLYQPSNEVTLFTVKVKEDYAIGEDILTTPYLELNDRSIIDDENRGQMMFNAFVDTSIEDPSEAWEWRGTRSKARNKGIAMHANLTGNFLLPMFTAQNENDEIDRDFSEVMRDIIEWMASPTNSNYQSSFLQVVFGMITNPVTYLGAEFYECYQTIKEKQADGRYTKKEILDEVLSGFKAPIFSSSQILITNAYERNIQKQRVIIKRRYCEKSELEAKCGEHMNWEYVQKGIKSIYNDEDGLFYDVKDSEHPNLVIEETYLNRRDDTEVCFVNGVYMGAESVDNNPIRHRDNKGAPKYNVTPFGYSRIGEHFFYYKSMMNALGWDNMLYDAMSEIVMNRALLEVDIPLAISGTDKIDSEVIFPKSVVSFKDKDVKVSPLLPGSNMNAGFASLREMEQTINEGSVNETMSGQLPDKEQKAYSVANAQAQAKKMIGAVGKLLAESIVQYGDLMKDIALNHITVPEVDELVGEGMKLKYRTFLLENKTSAGKKVDKKIKFDESLIGLELTDDEKMSRSLKLLEESGYPEEKVTTRLVNPELFAKFRYLTKCDAEEMFAKNAEYWQPVLSALSQQLAMNPFVDQEWLTRKLMYAFFQSEGDDGIKKQSDLPQINPQQNTSFNAMVRGKQEGRVVAGMV
mgnify:CR=1 FL=1